MYRGKFDAKNKGAGMTDLPKRREQQEMPGRSPAAQQGRPMQAQQPSRPMPGQQGRPMPNQQPGRPVPNQQGRPNPNGRPAPQQQGRPMQQMPNRQGQNMQQRPGYPTQQNYPNNYQNYPNMQHAPQNVSRGPRIGTLIFYTFYFLFIFVFFIGTFIGLKYLRSFLEDFEAAQPTVQSKQVFDTLFADPDWSYLYDLAGIQEESPYEGKEEFVAYMENMVGDEELNMLETSAGLTGGKKYYVRLGDKRVASFTMTGGENAEMTEIPDWKLGAVELFYERNERFLIQKMDGHTATVNGIALDDTHTIQISTTAADEYLPIQVTGNRVCIQEITGLMAMPEVKITDNTGKEMEVVYDEATRTFVEQTESNTITDELKDSAIAACKAYSLYMIEAVGADQVAKYFDTTSDIYKFIVRSDRWMQDYSDYRFGNEEVSNYVRYTEDLFSVKVSLSLYVTRKNGTVREYKVDDTLFFELQGTGKWLVFDRTNEDVTAPKGQVRLTFMDGDIQISSEFYDTDSKELTIPVPAAPSGKVFTGWYRKDVNENGTTTATVIFSPDENGRVPATGIKLEPMTLYALYQTADEAAANTAITEPAATETAATEGA